MTTYNTYQEAKIANPDSEIYQLERNGMFAHCDYHKAELVRFVEFDSAGIKCNPVDYCMTVERFLADEYRFVDGDLYIDWKGCVRGVGMIGHSVDACNDVRYIEDSLGSYILRASALEEDKPLLQTGEEYEHTKTLNFIYDRLTIVHGENQNFDYMHKLKNAIKMVESFESPCNQSIAQEKPRTKSDWVKVSDSIFNLKPDFEAGDLYISHCDGHYQQVLNESSLHLACAQGLLYRRTETLMTEREAFIDALQGVWVIDGSDGEEQFDKIVNSGLFKLVN